MKILFQSSNDIFTINILTQRQTDSNMYDISRLFQQFGNIINSMIEKQVKKNVKKETLQQERNNRQYLILNNYNKASYEMRNNYKSLFDWASSMITKCEQKNSQQTSHSWGTQIQLLKQQALIIQSILFEISERIKNECNEKGQIFKIIFNYMVRTINKLRRLFEINLTENSKQNLLDQERIQKMHQNINAKLTAQNEELLKQKMHKWKNLYMIIKDNRILRRQKGKLLRKHKQQVWRSKILEEDLIHYKRQSEKFRFLIDSLRAEENYQQFIKSQVTLNCLQKKIQKYPKKARRLLRNQLIALQIKQLSSFDKKIKMIIKLMEQNDEIYDDYDDWEQNIEPVKLFYNISTQTESEYEDAGTNTISQPQKKYQIAKTQTRVFQLSYQFQIYQVIQLQIKENPKKKTQRPERKTKFISNTINKMHQTCSPSRFRKKSSFEILKPLSFIQQQKKKQLIIEIGVFSLTIELESNKQISIEKRKSIEKQIKNSKSKRNGEKINKGRLMNLKSPKQENNVLSEKLLNLNLELNCQIFDVSFRPNQKFKDKFPISNKNSKIVESSNFHNKQIITKIQNNKNLAKQSKDSKLFNKTKEDTARNYKKQFHKRQKTEADSSLRQNLQPIRTLSRDIASRRSEIGIQQNKHVSKNMAVKLRHNNRKFLQKIVNSTFSSTTNTYLQADQIQEDSLTHGDSIQAIKSISKYTEQGQELLNKKYMLSLVQKLLKSLSTRRHQLLSLRHTFNSYLETFFQALYGATDKKAEYQQKFRQALINYTLEANELKISQIMVLKKLLTSSKPAIYQSDIFMILLTIIETAQKMGFLISSENYDCIRFDYGQKIIEYVCSFYLSPQQTQNFIEKYALINKNGVNLWKFFYCLEEELNKIVYQSELYSLLSKILPTDNMLVQPQKLDQLTYIFEVLNISEYYQRYRLWKYAKKGMPAHRIVLYCYRFGWHNFLNIETFIKKSVKIHLNCSSSKNLQKILDENENYLVKFEKFTRLHEIYKNWKQQYCLTNGHKENFIAYYYWVTFKVLEIDKFVAVGQRLSLIQQSYKKLVKLDKSNESKDIL